MLLSRAACSFFAIAVIAAGAVRADEKERLMFRPKPAEAYAARDSHEGLTIAAEPFETRDEIKSVFGKADLQKAGILPVLVVVENKTENTVRLDNLSVQFITATRQKIEPTPANEVLLMLRSKKAPRDLGPSKWPRIGGSRGTEHIEVQVHEFSMRMVPAGEKVHGFFYFDVGRGRDRLPSSKLYLTNLLWAHNAQPLLFFEINLDASLRGR